MSPVVRMTDAPAKGSSRAAKKDLRQQSKRSKSGERRKSRRRVPGAKKIVADALPGFSRQLAAMLNSGMPIVACLEALEDQTDNPGFKSVLLDVRLSIENGASFSEAASQFPTIFDELYVNMLKGGETGGQLSETIGRLAGFLEASAKLRRKVKSAMMYPTIVLSISLGIATAMIIFLVPVFASMFEDFGAKLPGPTQFLMNLSDVMRAYGIYVFLALVIAIVAFKKWKATPTGAYNFDKLILKTPVFGELSRKVASARFSRTFGQLIRSNVPILHAIEISSGATGNRVAGAIIKDAKQAVEKGEPLSSALINQSVFPVMVVRMLQSGEKAGNIDQMMDNIADFYDDEVDTMLSGLTSMLEPLLIVVLGIIVGGIVLCMFLPIFKMGEVVGG